VRWRGSRSESECASGDAGARLHGGRAHHTIFQVHEPSSSSACQFALRSAKPLCLQNGCSPIVTAYRFNAQRRKTMEWLIALIVLFFGILPVLFWLIGYCDKIGIEKARATHG
jgi:hypothetical protein